MTPEEKGQVWAEIRRLNEHMVRSEEQIKEMREQERMHHSESCARLASLQEKMDQINSAITSGQAIVRILKWAASLPIIGWLAVALLEYLRRNPHTQ